MDGPKTEFNQRLTAWNRSERKIGRNVRMIKSSQQHVMICSNKRIRGLQTVLKNQRKSGEKISLIREICCIINLLNCVIFILACLSLSHSDIHLICVRACEKRRHNDYGDRRKKKKYTASKVRQLMCQQKTAKTLNWIQLKCANT